MNRFLTILSIILLFPGSSCVKENTVNSSLDKWREARFGMFIHWGPVSLKGTEIGWSRGREITIEEYDNLYRQFNPVNFDAKEWVRLASDAGMKYIVFTSKHHDGFCMWDTKYNDFNIMNSPFGRDVMAELAEACEEYRMPLGFYHSTCDWHHPDFPLTSPGGTVRRDVSDIGRYTEYLKNQSVEIINKYGPLFVMWYDVPQEFDSARGQSVIDHIRKTQPDIVVNNRTGAEGDFDTPEQRIGDFRIDRPWETCMTIASQWAWKPDDPVKSLEQCLHSLIRSAGGDGNLLLNVGPMPDGRIEPGQAERLREMGEWLKEYGSSIYGTRGGPFKPTDWGVTTRKGNKIYLHVLNWFGHSPRIVIPDFGMDIKQCRLITGGDVRSEKQPGYTIIGFSEESLHKLNTIVELTLSGNSMDIEPVEVPPQSISYGKKATASSNPDPGWHDISSVNNGDWSGHYWIPSADDKQPWIEIDLGKIENISGAVIFEHGKNVQAFEIQYKQENDWITLYNGHKVDNGSVINFPETAAGQVRVVFKEFINIPEIYEIVFL